MLGQPAYISFNFTTVGVNTQEVNIRDLYEHMDLGTFSESFGSNVNPSGVLLLL